MLKNVLTACAVILLATPALAGSSRYCTFQPPHWARQEPTVAYVVRKVPTELGMKYCWTKRRDFTACAIDPATPGGAYMIVIDDSVPPDGLACVMTYEKAHLPPNNWIDKKWEKTIRDIDGRPPAKLH
jgi:hypothetical protein